MTISQDVFPGFSFVRLDPRQVRRRMPGLLAAMALLLSACLLAACGSGSGSNTASSAAEPANTLTLTVDGRGHGYAFSPVAKVGEDRIVAAMDSTEATPVMTVFLHRNNPGKSDDERFVLYGDISAPGTYDLSGGEFGVYHLSPIAIHSSGTGSLVIQQYGDPGQLIKGTYDMHLCRLGDSSCPATTPPNHYQGSFEIYHGADVGSAQNPADASDVYADPEVLNTAVQPINHYAVFGGKGTVNLQFSGATATDTVSITGFTDETFSTVDTTFACTGNDSSVVSCHRPGFSGGQYYFSVQPGTASATPVISYNMTTAVALAAEGSSLNPVIIPFNEEPVALQVDLGSSYYQFTGLIPGMTYLFNAGGLSDNATLLIYDVPDFPVGSSLCNWSSGGKTAFCEAAADAMGNLWLQMDGSGSASGTGLVLDLGVLRLIQPDTVELTPADFPYTHTRTTLATTTNFRITGLRNAHMHRPVVNSATPGEISLEAYSYKEYYGLPIYNVMDSAIVDPTRCIADSYSMRTVALSYGDVTGYECVVSTDRSGDHQDELWVKVTVPAEMTDFTLHMDYAPRKRTVFSSQQVDTLLYSGQRVYSFTGMLRNLDYTVEISDLNNVPYGLLADYVSVYTHEDQFNQPGTEQCSVDTTGEGVSRLLCRVTSTADGEVWLDINAALLLDYDTIRGTLGVLVRPRLRIY